MTCQLQKIKNVEEESSKKGLELNSKKTEVMVVSPNNECPHITIFINGNKLKGSIQILGYFNIKQWMQQH